MNDYQKRIVEETLHVLFGYICGVAGVKKVQDDGIYKIYANTIMELGSKTEEPVE